MVRAKENVDHICHLPQGNTSCHGADACRSVQNVFLTSSELNCCWGLCVNKLSFLGLKKESKAAYLYRLDIAKIILVGQ